MMAQRARRHKSVGLGDFGETEGRTLSFYVAHRTPGFVPLGALA